MVRWFGEASEACSSANWFVLLMSRPRVHLRGYKFCNSSFPPHYLENSATENYMRWRRVLDYSYRNRAIAPARRARAHFAPH